MRKVPVAAALKGSIGQASALLPLVLDRCHQIHCPAADWRSRLELRADTPGIGARAGPVSDWVFDMLRSMTCLQLC